MRKSCKVPAISGLGSRGDYYVEKYPGMDSGRTTDRPLQEEQPRKLNLKEFKLHAKRTQIIETPEPPPPQPEPVIEDNRTRNICFTLCHLLPLSLSGPFIALMAYAFFLTGINLGLIFLFVAFILCSFSGYLLVSYEQQKLSAQDAAFVSLLHDLGEKTLGKCGKITTGVFNFIYQMGVATIEMIFIKVVIEDAVSQTWETAPGAMKSTAFWAIVFIWVFLFPFLSCPNSKGVLYASYLATFLAFVFAIVSINGRDFYSNPLTSNVEWFQQDSVLLLSAFTFFLFPLSTHPSVSLIFSEMKQPTVRRQCCLLMIVYVLVLLFFITIGISGYVTFINGYTHILEREEIIFKTDEYSDWWPVRTLGVVIALATLISILNNLITTKLIFLEAIGKKLSVKCSINTLGSLVMCAILTLLAVLIQNTATLVKFLGVTIFPIFCFIFPTIFYIRAHAKSKSGMVAACKILGVVVSLLMFVYAILGTAYGGYLKTPLDK